MKHILKLNILGLTFFPLVSGATEELPEMVVTANRGGGRTFQDIATDLIVRGSNYALTLLVGLTVFVFLWGLTKYMFKGQESDTARSEGRKLMLWGLIGLFVMTSVWALVSVLAATIGHNKTGIPQFGYSTQVEEVSIRM